MSATDALAQIRADIAALVAGVSGPDTPVEDLVDVGTVLSAIVTAATEATADVKQRLRAAAVAHLGHESGKAEFKSAHGMVVVTVPAPKLTLLESADMVALSALLGAEFGNFFESKTVYTIRKDIGEQIIALPPGPARDALLAAVVEREQTPRVGFSEKEQA